METNEMKKLEDMHKDLGEIKTLLKGNSLDRADRGMIGEVDNLKARVQRLERFVDRGTWLVIGLAIGAGYALTDIVTKLFQK